MTSGQKTTGQQAWLVAEAQRLILRAGPQSALKRSCNRNMIYSSTEKSRPQVGDPCRSHRVAGESDPEVRTQDGEGAGRGLLRHARGRARRAMIFAEMGMKRAIHCHR